MKNLVTNGFKKLEVPELAAKGKFIISQMTANIALFPTPDPSLAILQDAVDEMEAAKVEADTGDKAKEAILAVKKQAVVDTLQLEGVYVNLKANGSRWIVDQSGFDSRKLPEPRTVVQPGFPKAERSNVTGQLKAKTPYQKAAKGFNWFITNDPLQPMNERERHGNQPAQMVFDNRVPGVTYHIIVEVCGPRKQQYFSPVVSVVA